MNIQEISKEIRKIAQEIIAESKYKVSDIVVLKEDMKGYKDKILAKKGDKVKIVHVYEGKKFHDYEVEALKNKEVFNVNHDEVFSEETRYKVNDEVILRENIEGTEDYTLAIKGDKAKILKVYPEDEAKKLGYDYEIKTLSNSQIFDVEHSSLK
jgi:hypothetical protein